MIALVTDSAEPPPASGCSVALRDCPTLSGDVRSLITHRIDTELCQKRQREQYHKCHRCVYRGQPANFVVETAVVLGRVEDKSIPAFVELRPGVRRDADAR